MSWLPGGAAYELVQGVADTAAAAGRGFAPNFRVGDYAAWIRAAVLLFVGLPVVYWLSRWVRTWVTRTSTAQRGMVVGQLLLYTGVAIILVSTLTELGFSLAPLLGAAGILGIALGFASQTSVSNIISGFFLMAEQPFVVGDLIQVGDTLGRVLSVDMMSVKLRTFDNKYVRIPNESLVKSQFTNITRFPVRRLDVKVGVAYREDIGHVREVLLDVADRNLLALMEPEPLVIFQGYGESSIDLLFAVWTTQDNFLALRTTLPEEIKKRFDQEDIEIPFPHRTLYAGSVSRPFPVRLVDEGREAVPEAEEGNPRDVDPGDAGSGTLEKPSGP